MRFQPQSRHALPLELEYVVYGFVPDNFDRGHASAIEMEEYL
ncbi:hypothetical protein [uncultured Mailhella sp.]